MSVIRKWLQAFGTNNQTSVVSSKKSIQKRRSVNYDSGDSSSSLDDMWDSGVCT